MESLNSLEKKSNVHDKGVQSNMNKRNLNEGYQLKERFIGDILEIKLNPIISKKGYLNFLEEKSIGWNKKYVVIFLFLFT